MGRIITIGQTKGGVGKSTLATHLGLGLAERGYKTLILDADEQGTTTQQLINRVQTAGREPVANELVPTAKGLQSVVQNRAKHCDYVVIDAGGRDTQALRQALLVSQLLVAPFGPAAPDLWTLDQFIKLIHEMNKIRHRSLPCYAVINGADPDYDSPDNRDARDMLNESKQFEVLTTQIVKRKSISRAAALGLTLQEYKPLDRTAQNEINGFIEALI
ncbi:MAG TPA: AAA family ATPase [Planctomycetaceae bacterium]